MACLESSVCAADQHRGSDFRRIDSHLQQSNTIEPCAAAINRNFKDANVQSWNLNVQHQVTRDTAIMIGYFGNKGTHLEIDRNINQPTVLKQ